MKSYAKFQYSIMLSHLAVLCVCFFTRLPTVTSQLFGTNEVIDCNEIYSISESVNGTIKTLGYPEPYPENRLCSILLKGNAEHRVMLKFKDFYLFHPLQHHRKQASCDGLDTLRIYDGPDDKSKLLGEYCGGIRPLPLMSSGPYIFLRLTSYTSGMEAKGYSADYSFVTNFGIVSGRQKSKGKCDFVYDSDKKKEGKITGPNPGGMYPSNTNCTYIFKGTFLERIYFKFHFFDLEGIEPCTSRSGSDFLEFSNTHGYDPCPTRRCGQFAPQEVVSDGPHFRIVFKSNDRLSGLGFAASYNFVTDENLPEWAQYLTNAGTTEGAEMVTLLLLANCFLFPI